MNANRVTLTVFGTTGVLLAASLTMLAIVSALVTFDAWPTRERGASAAEIAVASPHAAPVVRVVRRASATTGAGGSAGGGAAGGGPGPGVPGAGAPGGGDDRRGGGDTPGGPGGAGAPSGGGSPSPHVGPSPPGEDPNPPSGGPGVGPASTPAAVQAVASTAGSTVCGVSGAAGSVVSGC